MFRKQRRTQADFQEELQSHLALEAERLETEGLSADEARYAAQRRFGNVLHAEERFYERARLMWLDLLLRDVRLAVRSLAKSRGLTLAAVLILTLGIGANTAIFTVIRAVMLRTLPVQNPEELVLVETELNKAPVDGLEYPLYSQLRDRNTVLSHLAATAPLPMALGAPGDAQSAVAELVSGNYFAMLGLNPAAGRLLGPDDDRPGTPLVCVLNYGLWKQRFGSDPSVAGRTLLINSKPVSITGVAPAGFQGTSPGQAPGVWLALSAQQPIASVPADSSGGYTGALMLLGRRKPGVSLEQARAALQTIFKQIQPGRLRLDLTVQPGAKGPGHLRKLLAGPVAILTGTTILVLMIACANLATLVLARGMARRRDIAVRLMLGAGRLRLIAAMLVESLLVAGVGAAFGLFFSRVLVRSLTLVAPVVGGLSLQIDASIDWRVLLFSALTAIVTAVLFGLVPALSVTRMDPATAFKNDSGPGGMRLVLRKSLVAVQVALSVVLLCGAGLFAETLRTSLNLKLGFQPDNLILIKLDPAANGYTDAGTLYDELLARVRAMPVARSAALALAVPGSNSLFAVGVIPEGHESDQDGSLMAEANWVTPGYFRTMRMPVLAGRDFSGADRPQTPAVVMINRFFAARFWPGQSGVGKRLFGRPGFPGFEIVGIVPDQQNPAAKREHQPQVYFAEGQMRRKAPMTLHVRVNTLAALAVEAVRAEIGKLAPNLPVTDIKTMEGQLGEAVSTERLLAIFSAAFAVVALLLAGVGLYGMVAYEVVQRTRELGIRTALGARPPNVIRLVVARTGVLVGAGLLIGLPAAVAGARIAASLLHGIHPYATTTYLAAVAVLAVTSAVAALIPARRALSLNPATALRYE
jgi:predicted permease